jgi:diaminopimelate epimerase
MTVRLSKFHGLGNDFLVFDMTYATGGEHWGELSRRWCDRRRGVGADGLLLLGWQGPPATTHDITMVLYNADGSRAEMSGNGIRCVAHAAHRRQQRTTATEYSVSTDAGERRVHVEVAGPHTVTARVDMGAVAVLDEPRQWAGVGAHPDRPVAHLSLGNPHTVVGVDDVAVVDLAALGEQLSEVNLEIIEPGPGPDAVTMRVHERGVGVTMACGTGACAAAWAAVQWGLVPASSPAVTVHMEGGDARVMLHQPATGHVTLWGPSAHIADVVVAS